MNTKKIPQDELTSRMNRFIAAMDKTYPDWEMCAIVGDVNMYYFTGTICDGVLFFERGKEATLWVRKSYERAILESEFQNIRQMSSFRDVASHVGSLPDTLYLDMSKATLEWYGILSRHMKFDKVLPVDNVILNVRAIKSPFEIDIMSRAGKIADRLFREEFPSLLRAGMSEAELGTKIFSLFIENGYHGVSRFAMRNTDVIIGHIGFTDSPLYPSVFNGASGVVGLCPAAAVLGSRDIFLKEGDLVYIDLCFGIDGYNTDKTLIYSFKNPQPDFVNDAHNHCLELQKQTVSMMNAGEKPSDIYNTVCQSVKPEFRDRFMGATGRTVPFIGHGVGLYVDEFPVLANGFDQPLQCGMTIAVEPKIGIDGVGIVGNENTYLITESGAVSLTGESQEIILC